MYRLPFRTLFGLFALTLVIQFAAVGQEVQVLPVEQSTESVLQLSIDVPQTQWALGDEVNVVLTILNLGPETVADVALNLPNGQGIQWLSPTTEEWFYLGALAVGEVRTVDGRVRVNARTQSGILPLNVGLQGHNGTQVWGQADLNVSPAQAETIDDNTWQTGDGDIQLAFPPGFDEQIDQLTVQVEEEYRLAAEETGRVMLVRIASSNNTEAFNAPISVVINLSGRVDGATLERPLTVSRQEGETGEWTTVGSSYDPATGFLAFSAAMPAVYQVTVEPQAWTMVYDPPGASAYTGSANYSYALSLPPGIGGLTPEVSFNYSSRAADGTGNPGMSFGPGVGWSMPQARIYNANVADMYLPACGGGGCAGFNNSRMTLILNGVSYYLSPDQLTDGRHGTYKAIGGPELKIEFLIGNMLETVSREYWHIRTADGLSYTFGTTEDSEQVIGPVSAFHNTGQPTNDGIAVVNWMLNNVQDVHDNAIYYNYETACGQEGRINPDTGQYYEVDKELDLENTTRTECPEIDVALKNVYYNDGKSNVTLINGIMNERLDTEADHYMLVGYFRPTQIAVLQDSKQVASYGFTYADDYHQTPWNYVSSFWHLTKIVRYGYSATVGQNGPALPAQTFAYTRNVRNGCNDGHCMNALTRVDNGYGGVTRIDYALSGGWLVVQKLRTYDGVVYKDTPNGQTAPQSQTTYDYAGQGACFDNGNSICHMAGQKASKALVGFDGVVIKVLDSGGASLSERRISFYNDKPCAETPCTALDDSYWLIGKVRIDEQYAPGGTGVLVRDTYTWQQDQGDDQILSELHEHRPMGTWLASRTQYTYEPINYLAHQFGALVTKLEQEKKGNDSWENYRCTVYGYAHQVDLWLINRPIQETIKAPGCGGTNQAKTLYRYNDNTNPDDQTVEDNLPTYIMRWDGANYVTEKRTYTQAGLLETVTTYTEPTTGLTSYPTTARNTTTYVYAAESLGVPTRIESSGELFTTEKQDLTYNTRFPWLVAEVKYNGLTTKYTYDDFGRLSKVHNPGDDTNKPTVAYYYHDSGSKILLQPHAVGVVYKQDAGAARSDERLFYDGLGRLVQTQTANVAINGISGDRDVVVSYRYDARGLEVCRTAPHEKGPYDPNTGQNPYWNENCSTLAHTATQYDALGRPVAVTTPDNATSRMSYDVRADITVDTRNRFHIMTTYDGENHAVSQLSDAFGRLVMVREYTGNGGTINYDEYADTRYTYDVLGNLTVVRASAASNGQPTGDAVLRETTIEYDKLGRKTKLVDKDMGTWTYAYDVAGNLKRQKSPDNKAICFYFDGLNRPAQRQIDSTPSTPACQAILDRANLPASAPNHLASYVYGGDPAAHDVGQPRNVYWSTAPRANNDVFTYDAEGRLKTQTRAVNGQAFVKEVTTYDVHDRPTSVKYPDGNVLATTYDEEGVETLTAGSTMLIDAVGYNERGQLAFLGRKETPQTPTVPDTTLSYYPAGEDAFRLSGIANNGAATFPDFTYGGYDAAGNLTSFTVGSTSYDYGYDELNRLTSVTGSITRAYSYDQLGNFDTVTRAGTTWDYSYAPNNDTRLTDVTNLSLTVQSYDARGNLTKYTKSGVVYELVFDVENRLASVKVGTGQPTTFAYDADGQRVLSTYPDGTKVYTPFPDYEVTDPPTGTNVTRTTYRLGWQIVAIRKTEGAVDTFYYPLTDHLGNVIALSDLHGNFVSGSDARYDPFGGFTTPPATNPSISNHGFTGHRHNNTGANNLGLIYMNARYYLPEIGRFVSPDSIVPEPKNPQSYNRYSYSYNNPINYTDPSGHMATSGCDGLAEGCLSDPKYWGASFVYYLRNHIDFNDPASNPQGQIFLELYNYVLPLGQADGASINEIVSQVIVDTVSFVKHGRDSWYPIASDADLLVKTLLFASVAEAGTDSSINGEQGSVIPQYNRARYGSFKASTYREVLARDNSTCFYCGRHGVDVDLELDHVTPVKTHWFRGGYAMTDTELNAWYNNADNLVTACRSCNRSKGTSSGLFFMLRRIFGGQ